MMPLDTATLLTVTFVTTLLVGALFLLSWRQSPDSRILALWGGAHVAGGVAAGGLALRGTIPDTLSIGLANAVMIAAYGLIWSGVRAFEHRPIRLGIALAGAGVWCGLCLVPPFYGSVEARIVYASAVAALYCGSAAATMWHGRSEGLPSRTVAVTLLASHGLAYAVRIPVTLLTTMSGGPLMASAWVASLCFVALMFSIASAFTVMALVKERAEREQRIAARTDSLTGIANRRAFVEDAQAAIRSRRTVTLLLFDLDRFKGINDTYGHGVGDAVIVGFCEMALAMLPRGVLLSRFGGEEFACLLLDVPPAEARARAEGVRRAFAAMRVPDLPDLRLSVSIGIAHDRSAGTDFDILVRRADAALYAAKDRGRDRVEVAGTGQDLVQAA